MHFESVDIRILVENVFATALDMTVTPAIGNSEWPQRRAAIAIRGPWTGHVVIATTDRVLRTTVASMCLVHPHECTPGDLDDALLELTNLLGGSVKALLHDDCRLGMPEQVPHDAALPTGQVEVDRSFRCDGQPLRLLIVASSAGK